MSRLSPSHPFSSVGPGSIISCRRISILVTFGTPENYRIESVLFDIMEVNLPFNAIFGRSALYQFMIVVHYGYLVMKMPTPNVIIKIRGDHSTGVSTLEKLQALATTHEVAAGQGALDQAPSSSRQHVLSSAPRV
jgi:hypothetical protein